MIHFAETVEQSPSAFLWAEDKHIIR